jgi:hypothetical protein
MMVSNIVVEWALISVEGGLMLQEQVRDRPGYTLIGPFPDEATVSSYLAERRSIYERMVRESLNLLCASHSEPVVHVSLDIEPT